MTIRLHDTLSDEVRPFVPLDGERARIYSCGPTVQRARSHRELPLVPFRGPAVRHLRWRGIPVTWVMNITDIDDKIIKGAAAAGVETDELAVRYLERFLEDAAALGMTRPDVLPRATAHIPEIVDLIATLLEREHAYRTEDGSIFFRIASWPAYGRLARPSPSSSGWGSVSRPTSTPGTTSATSPCGRPRSGRALVGDRKLGRGAPAGTSSAR